MLADEGDYLGAHVVTVDCVYIDAIEKTLSRWHARFFMSTRSPPFLDEFGCCRFTKIMCEGRKHHRDFSCVRKILNQLTRAIDDELRVHKHIALRMPLWILRHSDQTLD